MYVRTFEYSLVLQYSVFDGFWSHEPRVQLMLLLLFFETAQNKEIL